MTADRVFREMVDTIALLLLLATCTAGTGIAAGSGICMATAAAAARDDVCMHARVHAPTKQIIAASTVDLRLWSSENNLPRVTDEVGQRAACSTIDWHRRLENVMPMRRRIKTDDCPPAAVPTRQYAVTTLRFVSAALVTDPFDLREGMFADFLPSADGGRNLSDAVSVRGYWDGGHNWGLRFAAPSVGCWRWATRCSKHDAGLCERSGALRVLPVADDEGVRLFRHGGAAPAAGTHDHSVASILIGRTSSESTGPQGGDLILKVILETPLVHPAA